MRSVRRKCQETLCLSLRRLILPRDDGVLTIGETLPIVGTRRWGVCPMGTMAATIGITPRWIVTHDTAIIEVSCTPELHRGILTLITREPPPALAHVASIGLHTLATKFTATLPTK